MYNFLVQQPLVMMFVVHGGKRRCLVRNVATHACINDRIGQNISDEAKDLVTKLLRKEPQKRLPLDEVIYV